MVIFPFLKRCGSESCDQNPSKQYALTLMVCAMLMNRSKPSSTLSYHFRLQVASWTYAILSERYLDRTKWQIKGRKTAGKPKLEGQYSPAEMPTETRQRQNARNQRLEWQCAVRRVCMVIMDAGSSDAVVCNHSQWHSLLTVWHTRRLKNDDILR